jgi:hypothetical protein
MNIVAALSTQLRLEEEFASGLTGGLLLLIEDVVREKAGFAAASPIRLAVPEMRDWQMSSPTLAPGMLSVDTIPPPPEELGVRGDFLAVLGRFGVDGQATEKIAQLMGQFLASRLSMSHYAVVENAMPMLAGK